MTQPSVSEVLARPWPARATFTARLAALEYALQVELDRAEDSPSSPRLPVTVQLTLDELASILPPAEQRLLIHLRTRKPLRALDGTPGFRSRTRRNARLQLLLSRVQVYCGSAVRHRLMQPYDRPGHRHRLRPGPRRRLMAHQRLKPLRLWVPRAVLDCHKDWFIRAIVVSRGDRRRARSRQADRSWWAEAGGNYPRPRGPRYGQVGAREPSSRVRRCRRVERQQRRAVLRWPTPDAVAQISAFLGRSGIAPRAVGAAPGCTGVSRLRSCSRRK